MPTISWFYGISIRVFFNDHPPPHFHAVFGRYEAKFTIADGELLSGRFPLRQQRLVRRWALMYTEALMRAWAAARNDEQPERIPGLDAKNDD